jgi:hypothetical protein
MEMDRWYVSYRQSAIEETGAHSCSIQAHRVEGWSKDYAFFGHPNRLDQVTTLIPRELVAIIHFDDWTEEDQEAFRRQALPDPGDPAGSKAEERN